MSKLFYYVIASILAMVVLVSIFNYKYFVLRYISICDKSDNCPKLKKHLKHLKKISNECNGPLTDSMTVREVYKVLANKYWTAHDECTIKLLANANGNPCPCKGT